MAFVLARWKNAILSLLLPRTAVSEEALTEG
jgi:hypothetical protein